jgi:predicted DNA-binding transcriptional regulator AlpA
MPAKLSARAVDQRPLPRVLSYPQFCDQLGISQRTGHRLLASGDGPKVTQLTDRRIGVREDHLLQWLNSRVVR